jgi:hypothetical protein
MSITKPENREQLKPPFTTIGEPGWESGLRQLLVSFDVPLPMPVTLPGLVERERALGVELPSSTREFLLTFGPVSFDYVEILAAGQICWARDAWPRQGVEECVTIANAGGPEGQSLLNVRSGECLLVHPDTTEPHRRLDRFDDLIRIACVDLYTGYYGWDDDRLTEMQADVMRDLFGFVL